MPIQKITKSEILLKALDLFQKKGYNQTSMEEIAQVCNLKKGSFYYYFKGKEEILAETLQMSLDFFREKIFAIAQQTDLSATERLEKMIKRHQKIILQQKLGCLFGKMTLEIAHENPDFKSILHTFFEEWSSALSQIYEAKYQPEYAKQLAQQTMIEMEGATILMQVYDNQEIVENCCKRIIERF